MKASALGISTGPCDVFSIPLAMRIPLTFEAFGVGRVGLRGGCIGIGGILHGFASHFEPSLCHALQGHGLVAIGSVEGSGGFPHVRFRAFDEFHGGKRDWFLSRSRAFQHIFGAVGQLPLPLGLGLQSLFPLF